MRPRGSTVADRVLGTEDVGKLTGVTSQRVSQLERNGIRKLWQRRARELLKQQGGHRNG